MEHVELTRELFTELFKRQLNAGLRKYPVSKDIEEFVNKTLLENIEDAYNMYLYCLDVYNKVRTGEEAKITTTIETKRGKIFVITDRDVCIGLKRKFITYEKFIKKFKDDIDVFAYIWKHIPTYSTKITVEELLGVINKTREMSGLKIVTDIRLLSLMLGAKIYIDDIWDYIPTE